MSEMIERVARAIAEADPLSIRGVEECEFLARAAIKALRQPTDVISGGPSGMVFAGGQELRPLLGGDLYARNHYAGLVWKAMIDEALKS